MSITKEEFTELYESSKGAVDFILYKVEHDDNLREDLVQEVFTAAWASRDSFAGAAQLKTWLMGVAKNIGRKYVRDEIVNAPDLLYEYQQAMVKKSNGIDEDDGEYESPYEAMDFSDPAAEYEFEQAMMSLSPEQQRAVEMRAYGYNQEEIALDMGISQQMVSKHLAAAQAKLMEE